MVSVIILGNEAEASQLRTTLQILSLERRQAILIAPVAIRETIVEIDDQGFIDSTSLTPAESLRAALARTRGSTVVFLDGRVALTAKQLANTISALSERSPNALTYVPFEMGGDVIELPDLSVDILVETIVGYSKWPIMMVSASKNFLENQKLEGTSIEEILAKLFVLGVADGENVSPLDQTVIIESDLDSEDLYALADSIRAQMLSTAVNSCNIEDLFPRHPWDSYQEESAAASYQTLAAQFIRLGDLDSARECLSFSDRLEDSPRSLALKALIAAGKGETLGAVANMVSSLQQYEVRKKNSDSKHYLTFTPADLEIVNSSLHNGLEALNRRNNEKALEHFAKAVFSFDSFYKENKVDLLKH